MDVQALELSIAFPRPGPVRRPGRIVGRTARPAAAPPGGNPSPGAIARRQARRYAYTGASIAAGLGALLWTTATIPIWPAIDRGLDGTALSGPDRPDDAGRGRARLGVRHGRHNRRLVGAADDLARRACGLAR